MICTWLNLYGSDCTNFWMSFWFSVVGVVLGAAIGLAISWWFGKKGKEDLDKALADAAKQIVRNMEEELDEAAKKLVDDLPAKTASQVKVNTLLDAMIAGAPLLSRAANILAEISEKPKDTSGSDDKAE
jgi:predicted Zn-dependent protease